MAMGEAKNRRKSVRAGAFVAGLLLLVNPSCVSDAKTPSAREKKTMAATDEAFVKRFLDVWLVRRDLNAAREYVSPDFFMPEAYRDPAQWPAAIRSAPQPERAIRFPFVCDNAPPSCRALTDCIESISGGGPPFEMQSGKIEQSAVNDKPELRPWKGRELVYVTFKLKGCNVATSLLLEKQGTTNARVISITYFAG
jgi:hypothetical protein